MRQRGRDASWRWRGTPDQVMQDSHTFFTTGNTQGFAFSSLYAPIPCRRDKRLDENNKNGEKRNGFRVKAYQINLVRAIVASVSAGKAEERIFGSLGDGVGGEVGSRSHDGREVTDDMIESGNGRRRGRGRRHFISQLGDALANVMSLMGRG